MGKIVATEFVSLDGVMEDPGGAERFEHGGWSFEISRGGGLAVARGGVRGHVQFDGGGRALDELRLMIFPVVRQREAPLRRHDRQEAAQAGGLGNRVAILTYAL